MGFVVAQLAFDQMRQRIARTDFVAETKANFGAVFGAHVMQIHFFAFGVLHPVHVFQQVAGHQVVKTNDVIWASQAKGCYLASGVASRTASPRPHETANRSG